MFLMTPKNVLTVAGLLPEQGQYFGSVTVLFRFLSSPVSIFSPHPSHHTHVPCLVNTDDGLTYSDLHDNFGKSVDQVVKDVKDTIYISSDSELSSIPRGEAVNIDWKQSMTPIPLSFHYAHHFLGHTSTNKWSLIEDDDSCDSESRRQCRAEVHVPYISFILMTPTL